MRNSITIVAEMRCGLCGHVVNEKEFHLAEGEPYGLPVPGGSCKHCDTPLSKYPPTTELVWRPDILRDEVVGVSESVAFISALSPTKVPREMVGAQTEGYRFEVDEDSVRVYGSMEPRDYRLLLEAARGHGDVTIFEKEDDNE